MRGVAFFLCLSGAAFAAPPQFPIENVSVRSIGPGGGGFIDCVLASRHSKTRFYAGCDVGGFYRSDDGGRNWRILNDGFSNQMCESIAEHPRDPDVLVAGSDGGVYVSRDGGYHWEHPTEGFPPAQGFGYGRPIIRVEFDETNPDHVWAASGCPRGRTGKDHLQGRFGRIFESFDAGRTWRRIKDESGVLAQKETEIRSFSASSRNAKDLLVSTSRGVFRSLDGGRNWTASGEGIPVEEGFGPEILARCASAPDVVYLSARSNRGEVPRRCGVWKSTDGGATWRACGTPPAYELRHAGEWAHSYWSHPHLVCDAKDPDVCWASSVTWLSPQGVWKTEDGGQTWAQKFDLKHRGWLDFWGFFSGALTVSRTFRDTVAFGTSGTIYRTDDAGASWRQAYTTERADGKLQGSGLETIYTQCVYADRARKDRMYFGFNDVALFVSEDRGRTLKRTMKGVPDGFSNSCFDIRQAEDEPNRMWAVFGRWGGDESGLFCESTDGGESWSVKTNGFVCGAWARIAVVRGVKPYCLAVVRTGYHRPERRGTTMTWDGGESWHEVSTNDLPIARRPCSVFADRGTILVGSGSGRTGGARIFASKDLGHRWFEIPAAAEMRMGNIREFAVSGKTIAVACQSVNEGLGGVFVSRDCGKTWRHALRDWCASSVAFAGSRLFATCPRPGWCDPNDSGHGLVVSDDFGETWRQCRGTGFYRGPVSMVVADPFDASALYVGTGGNGVFEVRLPEGVR